MNNTLILILCALYTAIIATHVVGGNYYKAWYWFAVVQITIAVEWGMK